MGSEMCIRDSPTSLTTTTTTTVHRPLFLALAVTVTRFATTGYVQDSDYENGPLLKKRLAEILQGGKKKREPTFLEATYSEKRT